jgi:hypothetical protein
MRRLFTFLSALSLLLCVALVGLWVWSYSTRVVCGWLARGADRDAGVEISEGKLCFYADNQYLRSLYMEPRPEDEDRGREMDEGFTLRTESPYMLDEPHNWGATDMRFSGCGFFYSAAIDDDGTSSRWFIVPFWAVASLTVPLPLAWGIRRWKGKRRKRPGLCPSCGYDLRATPDRCSECGAVPEPAKVKA